MVNLLIIIAFAFLFWGKVTKEEEEKIQNASWTKTAIYFSLAMIVGVFYIKTYQVATIKNLVQVDGYRCAHNIHTDEIVDTVEVIDIMNRYTRSNFYGKLHNISLHKFDEHSLKIDNTGGLYLVHTLKYDSLTQIKTHADNFNNDVKGIGHNYTVTYIASKVPSISLFQHKFEEALCDSFGSIKDHFIMKGASNDLIEVTKKQNNPMLNYFGPHGLYDVSCETTFDLDSIKSFSKSMRHTVNSYDLNTFNFFTAADISQCSYVLGIISDCPIKKFQMTFDIPVELSPLPFKTDVSSAYGFAILDPNNIKEIQNTLITTHIKFPTLANMQLIRSLILTTVLSALLTLFLSNFYFLVCRIIRYIKKELNYQKDSPKIKLWRIICSSIAFILCTIIIVVAIFILKDKYLWLNENVFILIDKVLRLFVFVILCGFIFLVYYLVKKKVNRKKK